LEQFWHRRQLILTDGGSKPMISPIALITPLSRRPTS